MEETLVILQQKSYRYETADTHRLLGLAITRSDRNFIRAEREYLTALSLARSIHAQQLEGTILMALGGVYSFTDQYDKAQYHLDQAISVMQEAHSHPIEISDAYRVKARIHLLAKHWKQALQNVQNAATPEAIIDKNFYILLVNTKAKALSGLGRFEEAAKEWELYASLQREIHETEKQNDLNRLKVDMGLLIEEEQNKKLIVENEIHRAEAEKELLYRKIAFGLALIAIIIVALMAFSLMNAKKVKVSQNRMKRILDNIDEGIMTIGPGLVIETDLSPYLGKILEDSSRSKTFHELIEDFDLQVDEKQTLLAALLAVIGEDSVSWEFNVDHLIRNVSLKSNKRNLALEWNALYHLTKSRA